MRGLTHWNYRPFTYLTHMAERNLPVVCRVAPGVGKIEFEWYDQGDAGEHAVRYRLLGEEAWHVCPLSGPVALLDGLKDQAEYEFKVYRVKGEGESQLKYARTGFIPSAIINYIHPREKEINALGYCPSSPSICRLPSGALLSSHDVWAEGKPSNITQMFKSEDEGKTWRHVTDVCPCLWGALFVHRGKLYNLSCAMEYGNLQISCSEDEGKTWSYPVLLMHGGGFAEIGPHKAPVPIIEHKGRLYTAIEFGAWKIADHQSTVLSIDAEADLLNPANWQYGPFLQLDRSWPDVPSGLRAGYIEGNVVVGPDGILRNILRLDYDGAGKALMLRVNPDDPEASQEFEAVIQFPVGVNSKFEVRQDPQTGKYIALGNEYVEETRDPVTGNPHFNNRLVLSMAVSDNLYDWKVVKRVFDYRHMDPEKIGFQYPSWLISGDDIYLQTRVAFNGGETFHNGNCETFTIIENFRQYY